MADVKLTITGEDKTGPARQGLMDTERALGMVKTAAAAVGISLSALALANLIKDSAMLAARYETLGVTMNVVGNNAGYTSQQMTGFQESLQKTGIAMVESRQSLVAMAQAHIDLANSSKLARIAQDAAVIGGINSSEAFSRLVYGIQSAQTEVLRTIGLNVNFEDSYKKLAIQLGKSAEDLTELEKAQARTNAVMDKGKDISGAYEAAMGTAGKQLTSMKRYMDDLKVKAGEVFQDALVVGVSAFTDGLKDANTEADKLHREGKLQEWGRDLVQIMAIVADGVHIVYLSMYSLVATGVAGFVQLYYGAKAFGQALTMNFSGAADSFAEMKSAGSAWLDLMKDKWSGATMFQDSAKKMYADRDANAAKEKALANEQEQRRMAAAAAAKQEQAAKDAAAKSEKDFLNNLKNSISGIKDYAAALADMGKERLKFAEEKFSDQLKEEVNLFGQGKAALEGLVTPLKRYNVEVNDVYNQRLTIEKDALNKLGGLYADFRQKVKINANTKEVQQQGVEIVKAYKDAAEKIIGIEQTRYTTLYEGERKLYEQFKTLNDAKKKEIEDLRNTIEEANKAYEASRRQATGNFSGNFSYLDPNLDDLAKRQAMTEKLRRDEAEAANQENPDKRKEKLLAVAEAWMQLNKSVELGGQTVITTEQAWNEAMSERDRIQKQVFSDLEQQQKDAARKQEESASKLDTYRNKLMDLDNIIKRMNQTVTIDLKVNGIEQISRIQSYVGQATASAFSVNSGSSSGGPDVSKGQVVSSGSNSWDYYQSGDSFYWGDGSYAGPAYEKGTDYVPKTTLALVHQGEKITPAGANTTGVTINGGITITLQSTGYADSDTDAVARALIPAINRQASRSL